MDQQGLTIVYDGECPFCSRYVGMLRLREAAGSVELIDARSDHPVVDQLVSAGYDLNEGMVLVDGDQIFHGDACIHRLALMSTPSTFFNRINRLIFKSQTASKLLYPVLRTGRNTTLRLMGRKPLELGD